MDDSVWGFIGIFVALCGVYSIYSSIKMKMTGEINASLLLGKDYIYKMCKNKEEYVSKAGAALLIFGIIATVYGVIDIIHCYVYSMPKLDVAAQVVFFIALVWFALYTIKLKQKYY